MKERAKPAIILMVPQWLLVEQINGFATAVDKERRSKHDGFTHMFAAHMPG